MVIKNQIFFVAYNWLYPKGHIKQLFYRRLCISIESTHEILFRAVFFFMCLSAAFSETPAPSDGRTTNLNIEKLGMSSCQHSEKEIRVQVMKIYVSCGGQLYC